MACDRRFSSLYPDFPYSQHTIHSITCDRFIKALAKGKPLYDTDTLRNYVTEDLAVIEEIAPDLVVGDFRLSLAISAPSANVPYLTISNAYWSPYAKQHFSVPELPLTKLVGVGIAQTIFNMVRPAAFAMHTVPLNRVRREYGLTHLGWDLRRSYTWADHTLYADIPELVPTYDLPANHHYLGPILWSPTVPLPDWWKDISKDMPTIYVTLGSSGQKRYYRLFWKHFRIFQLP